MPKHHQSIRFQLAARPRGLEEIDAVQLPTVPPYRWRLLPDGQELELVNGTSDEHDVAKKITGANEGGPARLQIQSLWAVRIAQFYRWSASMRMKLQAFIGTGQIPFLSVLLFASAAFIVAAQTNTTGKVPTGLYVSSAEISPTFSMRFDTNGQYQVEIGPCGPLGCLSQKGKWRWDDQKEEFLLTPIAPVDLWHFDFRRFRVDKQQPNTLQWFRLNGAGNVLGVYESVRFRRQGD